MALAAAAIFALAALGGLFLAFRHFTQRSLPFPVTLVHGLAAAAGLGVLLFAYLGAVEGAPAVGLPLALLGVAALGGFFLVAFHLRGRRAPSAAVVVHALAAVAGFVALLLALR